MKNLTGKNRQNENAVKISDISTPYSAQLNDKIPIVAYINSLVEMLQNEPGKIVKFGKEEDITGGVKATIQIRRFTEVHDPKLAVKDTLHMQNAKEMWIRDIDELAKEVAGTNGKIRLDINASEMNVEYILKMNIMDSDLQDIQRV